MSSPAVSLIQGLIAGLRDGSLSPQEGGEVLEACAELIEELAEEHVKSWWARLILSAAAGAVRQAADEGRDIPSNEDSQE